MSARSRRTAKDQGTRFETMVARYLAEQTGQPVERRRLSGSHDRGDLSGVVSAGGAPLVVECKDTARFSPRAWLDEALVEAENAGAVAGIVVYKRPGVGYTRPERQGVLLRMVDLAAVAGERAGLRVARAETPAHGGYDPEGWLARDEAAWFELRGGHEAVTVTILGVLARVLAGGGGR